ncbi:MAG: hypothetical protein K9L78_04225, partial [Victivallales bacterium]|nr:hypothetical protein [Victivallales bacterium]
TIEIIPRIHVSSYFINIDDITIQAVSINPIKATDEVVVFTPEYRFKNDTDFLYNLSEFAPKIPIDSSKKRINIFVANEGNGEMPEEKIIKVWKGEAPIPSFGAVISLTEDYYNKLFCNNDLLKSSINITPIADDFNFANYSRILGGFVPAVSDYVHLYDVQYVDELMSALDQYGNALSPLAQAGRETRNFDPYIREPAGLFVETADKIGWILFDGRHELTIGVSIADAVKILTKMEKDNILPGNIRNAFFIDGGSAMKAYISELEGWAVKGVDVRTAIQDEEEEQNQDLKYNVSLKLLNRVAAGARNGPGNDPNGLNLYSTLQLPL